jgi:hypothetical protein
MDALRGGDSLGGGVRSECNRKPVARWESFDALGADARDSLLAFRREQSKMKTTPQGEKG